MERTIKKLAEQQAIRATSTSIMSSWLTNSGDASKAANPVSARLREGREDDSVGIYESAPQINDDSEPEARTENHMDKDAPLSPSKDAGLEPTGMKEWINRRAHADLSSDSAAQEVQTTRPHRRLIPAENSESESEGDGMEDESRDVEKDLDSAKYLDQVTETNKGSDESDVEQGEGSDDNSGSDSEERISSNKKVDIADFDDEEEFLLAGGEVEDAKRKKEWGLHQSNEEADKEEEDAVIGSTKDVSVSKENLRKLQRESERLLRERRCMIRPAPVHRRSFGDLIQKISARATILEKSKESNPGKSTESNSALSEAFCAVQENMECLKTFHLKDDKLHLDLQHEIVSSPPNAPGEECDQANANPVGLNEDDEEDEELIIINSDKPNVIPEVKVPRLLGPYASPLPKDPEKKPYAVSVPQRLDAFSPPANNSKKMRMALLESLRKTAQLRSEHLSKVNSTLKVKPSSDASPLGDAAIMNLQAVKDLPFIPSISFVGSKQGYVYKFDSQGLGYYPDLPKNLLSSNSSTENNVLPPPIEDLPDDQKAMKSILDEEEGDSQPFVLEAGEKLILEYEEDAEGESVPMHGATDMEADLENTGEAVLKPLRTYAKKDKTNDSKQETEGKQSDSAIRMDTADDVEASDSRCGEGSGFSTDTMENIKGKIVKRQLLRSSSKDDDSDEESAEDADDEEDDGEVDAEEKDSSDEAEETSSEDSESSDDASEGGGEEEEDEVPEAAAPVKKTLADITSIKRQTTLRLGTMEAGYLRTEQEVLGIHDDIGVAEEDLGEGIDLENTDGEDDSEEDEDSEAERQVAQGFLEDAKYAGEVNPDLLRQVHMEITDQDEKRMTEKILDVVRGEARRRKAAKENDDWIPNRGARVRLQNGGGDEAGDADRPLGDGEDGELEDEEEEAARIASVLAKERLERLRFMQLAKESQKELESSGDEAGDQRQVARPAPMVRKVSCAVPSLAEFGSKFAGGGLVRSVSGGQSKAALPAGRPLLKRGSSLLGSAKASSAEGAAHQPPGTIVPGKVFFFDTKQRTTDAAPEALNSPEPMSALQQETPMTRKRSDGGWGVSAAKVPRIAAPMQRSVSVLRENLDSF